MACLLTIRRCSAPKRAAWLYLVWLLCLTFGLFSIAGHVYSQDVKSVDPIVHRAFWEDKSAQVSFEMARHQAYTAYPSVFSRGYTDSVHWIRLTIAARDQPLGLRITPAWLDNITLYDAADSDAPITVGDRHPVQNDALPGLGHSFKLKASTAPRDVWLRLESTSSHFLDVKAFPLDQTTQAGTRQIIWATLYAAVLALMLFVLLSIWSMQRDRVLGAYLVRHAVYTYYGAAYLGLPTLLLSDWLPPTFFDLAFSISATIIVPLGLWFDVSFLSGYRPHKHLLRMLKVIGILSVGVVLILVAGHTRIALQMNAYVLMISVILMAMTAASCRPDPSIEQIMPQKVMLTYYILIFSNLLIGMVNVLGWAEVREWSFYSLILHGLVSGLMMTTILMVRAQRMTRLNQQINWELQKIHQELDQEQRRNRDKSQFLHMLMHELKTPLSIVSLALGNKNHREENLQHAGRAVQNMKAIIDRCVQVDQLGQVNIPQQKDDVNATTLLQQLELNIPLLGRRLLIDSVQNLPLIQTDQHLLQIILTNLLDNAARYSDPLTSISVTLEATHQESQALVCIRIRNTPGQAGWPDTQQLFTKYYRASRAQRESGSGLGLFLARQLAQSLGGTLDYAPSDQHVEFVLCIPFCPA